MSLHPVFIQALKPFAPPVESDGLWSLIIPQEDTLNDVMGTTTAQRLVARGASLYMLKNGTSVLSVSKPKGAFCKACSLPVFWQDDSNQEVDGDYIDSENGRVFSAIEARHDH